MNYVQVYRARGEMEATIVKGFFENVGIKAGISSLNSPMSSTFSVASSPYLINTPDTPYGVYVDEKDAEEAKKVLTERK